MSWEPLPGSPSREPRRLSDSLAAAARQMGVPEPTLLDLVFGRWPEVVGPALAARCRPVAIRDRTLVVAVDEPGWATELRYLGPTVLGRVHELAGPGMADRLEVRVQPLQ